jgi:DNA-binding beta-propeller fold protein YncE
MGNAGQPGAQDGTEGFGTFNHPRALAVTPGGYVYIADTDNDIVRQFYPNGNGVLFNAFLATLARGFNRPAGITVGANGTVYVTDTGSAMVRKIVGLDAVVSTVAGRGAELNAPAGIAIDSSGNLFVADTNNAVIKKMAADGTVSTFAGSAGQQGMTDGLGVLARFNHPTALAFDVLGNLYVADTGNNAIRRIAPSTLVTTVVTGLNAPGGIAFDFSGRLLIADSGNHAIRLAVAAPPAARRRRSVQH